MRVVSLLIAATCVSVGMMRAEEAPPAKKRTPGELLASGDQRLGFGNYGVVFYFFPEPKENLEPTLKAVLTEFLPELPLVRPDDALAKPPMLVLETEQAPLKRFPVPPVEDFQYCGRGMDERMVQDIQGSKSAAELVLITPKDKVWEHGRAFTRAVGALAKRTGAAVWDTAARECYSESAWRKNRIETWGDEKIPDVSTQFTIHLYRAYDDSQQMRAITLGMEKFALPDLVVERLVAGQNRSVGSTINLVAQLMAEKPFVPDPNSAVFRLSDRKTKEAGQKPVLLEGATGTITLALVNGRWEDGDPENCLVELDFRHGEGKSRSEKMDNLLGRMWGAHESVVEITHSPEVLAASREAKAKLPALRKAFLAGLAPKEHLLVKAPFLRDDNGGNEWMWIEVMRWKDEARIEGILQNMPFHVPALKAGAEVTIKTEDVFDYLLYKADGSTEGNKTGELMRIDKK